MSEKVSRSNQFASIKSLILGRSGFWALSKDSVEMFGIETAFILTNLAEAEDMLADEEGWFYQTADTLERFTGMSRYRQDKSISELEKYGIVEKELRGLPARRFFKLNYEKLEAHFQKHYQERVEKNGKLEDEKLERNKELSNKEIRDKELTNKDISRDALVDKETVSEETGIHEEVVEYLNKKADRSYRPQTPSTKRLIRARQNEGFKLEDFKAVIDKKTAEWKGGDMDQYLRPTTLFGPKFESYLNQKTGQKQKQRYSGGYQPRALPTEDDYNKSTDFLDLLYGKEEAKK